MTTEALRNRRAGGVLIGAGVLACAAGVLLRVHAGPSAAESSAAAEQLHTRVQQVMASRAQRIEPRAAAAASLPEIASALALGADPHTAQDLLETEDWWAPFRAEFALSGLVSPAGPLAMTGPSPGDITEAPLIRQARADGAASGVLVGGGRAFLAATRRVDAGRRAPPGVVVVLGIPLDKATLGAIAAESAQGSVIALHISTVGEMAPGRAGAVWPLDAGLWLLATFPGPGPDATAGWGRALPALEGIGAAALLLGVAMMIAFRRGPPAGAGLAPRGRDDVAGAQVGPLRDFPASGSSSVREFDSDGAAALALAPDQVPADATVMGRYRLIERIGEGGMAEVFTAAAFGPEGFIRKFVVKRMHPHLARNRAAVAQFIDEARLQSTLIHSNIVPVYDFGKTKPGGEYYLAMEHIQGRDLERVVRRHVEVFGRSLSVPVAFYIIQELLEGLAYAHGRPDAQGRPTGIVHRDIAPGNILISYRGEVKLTDFGIAKADDRISKTDAGEVKGNAAFMSPEQARGEAVDARSDLFSAGVVLYYCLTSQLLYGDSDPQFRRMLRVASGPASTEFERLNQVTPLAADVLRKALAADVAGRYPNARAFARDLVGHFTGGRAELADLMQELFPDGSATGG